MASTLRADVHRAQFLARLAKSWDKRPDLSFGELLSGALEIPKTLSDEEIAKTVERFVMFDPRG